MTHRQQQAAFLDRDGTVIEDAGYLATLDDIRFLPGAILAIKRLNDAGFLVVIATNQSGVARGYFSESFVLDVHEAMNRQLRSHGAHFDGLYYCPHHVDGSVAEYSRPCECRKPKTGMFQLATRLLGPFSQPSYMFGDRESDMEFARSADLRPCFIGSHRPEIGDVFCHAASLADAVVFVLTTR